MHLSHLCEKERASEHDSNGTGTLSIEPEFTDHPHPPVWQSRPAWETAARRRLSAEDEDEIDDIARHFADF